MVCGAGGRGGCLRLPRGRRRGRPGLRGCRRASRVQAGVQVEGVGVSGGRRRVGSLAAVVRRAVRWVGFVWGRGPSRPWTVADDCAVGAVGEGGGGSAGAGGGLGVRGGSGSGRQGGKQVVGGHGVPGLVRLSSGAYAMGIRGSAGSCEGFSAGPVGAGRAVPRAPWGAPPEGAVAAGGSTCRGVSGRARNCFRAKQSRRSSPAAPAFLPSAAPPSPRGFMGGCPRPDRSSGPGVAAQRPSITPTDDACVATVSQPSKTTRSRTAREVPSRSPPMGGDGPCGGYGTPRCTPCVPRCGSMPAVPYGPWSLS